MPAVKDFCCGNTLPDKTIRVIMEMASTCIHSQTSFRMPSALNRRKKRKEKKKEKKKRKEKKKVRLQSTTGLLVTQQQKC